MLRSVAIGQSVQSGRRSCAKEHSTSSREAALTTVPGQLQARHPVDPTHEREGRANLAEEMAALHSSPASAEPSNTHLTLKLYRNMVYGRIAPPPPKKPSVGCQFWEAVPGSIYRGYVCCGRRAS